MRKKLLFIPLAITLGAVVAGFIYHCHSASEEEEEEEEKPCRRRKKK